MSQLSFCGMAFEHQKKQIKRRVFLDEMERVVPWSLLEAVIEPFYPKVGNGRPPMPLGRMLRLYFMQQWYGLSDPAMEEALYDSHSMQRFAGIDPVHDSVPDETTILHFRHLLEKHQLTALLFAAVNEHLSAHNLLLQRGTIVDATIIRAASSTKNRTQERDPEMSSTRKGGQYYFGMKAHIGVDSVSGLAHSVVCGTAREHDSKRMDELLHGAEREIYGDKAYVSEARKQKFQRAGRRWRVSVKAKKNKPLNGLEKYWNKSRNKIRAKVEHVFGVVKNLWGYRKVRYRGLFKNQCQIETLMALANLFLARDKLLKTSPTKA